MAGFKSQIQGAQNRAAGLFFENLLEKSLRWYEDEGLMKVTKTPEPMKPIRPMNKSGQFIACYTKQAQVDFSGTITGGRSIRFEAKQTDTTRFTRNRLSEEQMNDLEKHSQLGALCYVIICFGFDHVYRIPWTTWRDMKKVFGRQYVNEKDVEEYRDPCKNGIFKIIDIDDLKGDF